MNKLNQFSGILSVINIFCLIVTIVVFIMAHNAIDDYHKRTQNIMATQHQELTEMTEKYNELYEKTNDEYRKELVNEAVASCRRANGIMNYSDEKGVTCFKYAYSYEDVLKMTNTWANLLAKCKSSNN